MWGVENGRDNLMLGGDIHYDNPAEEVNLFDVNKPGRDYGYPHCWSEGIWMDTTMAKGPGTQHLDPDQPGSYTEAKCQDANAVVPPAFALGAHIAPLDIIEYRGRRIPVATCRATCSSRRTARGTARSPRSAADRPSEDGRERPHRGAELPRRDRGAGGSRRANGRSARSSIRIDKAGLLTFSDDTSGTVNKIGYKP